MAHPEKPSSRKKRTTNAQLSTPSEHPVSPSLAAQPTAAPGAIPEAGTGTELEALRRTQEQVDTPVDPAVLAERMGQTAGRGKRELNRQYDASIIDKEALAPTGEGLVIVDTLNQTSHQINPETGTLAKIEDIALTDLPKKFNGVEMTEVSIPHSAPIDSNVPVVGSVGAMGSPKDLGIGDTSALKLSAAEAYALTQEKVVAEDQAIVDEQDAVHRAEQFAAPTKTTRLKMTLHSVTPIVPTPTVGEGEENPLTRCTFGAVYSPNPTEEDGVFGKATPFGSLTYNVRADVAEGLQVGTAYYVDITQVPA